MTHIYVTPSEGLILLIFGALSRTYRKLGLLWPNRLTLAQAQENVCNAHNSEHAWVTAIIFCVTIVHFICFKMHMSMSAGNRNSSNKKNISDKCF